MNHNISDLLNPHIKKLSNELSQKLKIFDAAFERNTNLETIPHFDGRRKQRKSGIGDEFFQFRPLQANESISLIDWRASAKSDNLQIKQKEIHAKNRLYIWLDLRPSMFWVSRDNLLSKAQIGMIVALAISEIARKNQIEVRTFTKTQKSFASGLIESGKYAPAPVAAPMIILSDCMHETDEICEFIGKFRGINFPKAFGIINDSAECDFDFDGRINFIDKENHETIIIEDCQSLQEKYKAEIQDHFSKICATASEIPFSVAKTDNSVDYYEFAQSLLNAIYRGF